MQELVETSFCALNVRWGDKLEGGLKEDGENNNFYVMK